MSLKYRLTTHYYRVSLKYRLTTLYYRVSLKYGLTTLYYRVFFKYGLTTLYYRVSLKYRLTTLYYRVSLKYGLTPLYYRGEGERGRGRGSSLFHALSRFLCNYLFTSWFCTYFFIKGRNCIIAYAKFKSMFVCANKN